MGKTADIRARITTEDASTSVLKRIKDSFLGSSDAAEKAEGHAAGFLKQVASTALGMQLVPMISRVKDLSTGFLHAGIEAQGADQAVAGLIASVQGIPWQDAFEDASNLGDKLDDIAIKAGQMGSDVQGAFNAILELKGASEEGISAALRETTQISTVANVLGKSAEGLAREFGLMGEGMLRTKGQLFQLLQPTGIFGDNVKKASERWAKMTEESRASALAYGLDQVSSRLSKATPTIGDYITTLQNLKDVAVEKFGEPLSRALEPALKKMIERLQGAIPAIERLGQSLAKDVGRWVEDAAKTIEEGFKYLETHQEEIKKSIVEAWTTAKEIVQWILAHKTELAIAFGASKAAPLLGAGARTAASLAGGLTGAAATGIPALGIAGSAAGAAATFGAFGLAVAAFALAVDQWGDLMQQTEGGKSEEERNQGARSRMFQRMIENPELGIKKMSPENIKNFEEVRKAFVETATELGENSRAAGDLADKAWKSYRSVREMVEPAESAAKLMDQFQKSLQAGMIPDEASLETQQQIINQVATGFESARQRQNTAALQYIADTMLKSEGLRNAFLTSANLTGEGFDLLADLVAGKSEEFAAALRARAGETKGTAATAAAPKVVMTGGQTFNIKQDFRDQDPDRVAITFERDVGKMVERRIQASTSSPFGM